MSKYHTFAEKVVVTLVLELAGEPYGGYYSRQIVSNELPIPANGDIVVVKPCDECSLPVQRREWNDTLGCVEINLYTEMAVDIDKLLDSGWKVHHP